MTVAELVVSIFPERFRVDGNSVIRLSQGTVRTLKREASGCPETFLQLARESVARRWLRSFGIPSFRNPATPSSGTAGRYSIMLTDGSRFMVVPASEAGIDLDRVASARCFGVLGVDYDPADAWGTVTSFLPLARIASGTGSCSMSAGENDSPAAFLESLNRPGRYLIQSLIFSIRLLIVGEPEAPPPKFEVCRRSPFKEPETAGGST